MSDTVAGLIFILLLVAALAAAHRPLGDYMARVYTTPTHWRVERLLYRAGGVDPDADQRWPVYLRSVLAFSAVSVLLLYLLQRVQAAPAAVARDRAVVPAPLALNTAAAFVTNTNWQSYSGESTMGHLVQMAGLAVQNFVSAAVGIAVAIALVRGFARARTDRIGNFWVDLVRLHPCASCCRSRSSAPVVLIAGGVVQNLSRRHRRAPRWPAATRRSPAGRSPPRRRSRSSAPTAAASTTPTPPTPSRTRPPDQLARDLPAAADPVRLPRTLRPDGRATAGRATRSSP